MRIKFYVLSIALIFATSCKNKFTDSKSSNSTSTPIIQNEEVKREEDVLPDLNQLQIQAFLVFDDHTVYPKDIFTSNINLFNVVIGEFEGGKASDKVKLVIKGKAKDFNVNVQNDGQNLLNKHLLGLNGTETYLIKGTGCGVFTVTINDNKTSIIKTKEFECGE